MECHVLFILSLYLHFLNTWYNTSFNPLWSLLYMLTLFTLLKRSFVCFNLRSWPLVLSFWVFSSSFWQHGCWQAGEAVWLVSTSVLIIFLVIWFSTGLFSWSSCIGGSVKNQMGSLECKILCLIYPRTHFMCKVLRTLLARPYFPFSMGQSCLACNK